MTKALYRRYRSRALNEVVGQDHVVKTLSKALKSGRIRHAYLFSGPKGVGKTSVARILAHEINKLPYDDDTIHLDIIEIDAASNRRIDEVRDLRDKVHITPTSAKYKVYIIDEVHMLTREAFNALLKTLEEPPEHCIFILATTEAHKLPETITSRTQHFTFKALDNDTAAGHLAAIAKKEKIDITPGALQLLASYGQGSLRDSISLLDQLSSDGQTVTEDSVRLIVGMPSANLVADTVEAVKAGDSRLVIQKLDELADGGANYAISAKLISEIIRNDLLSEGDVQLAGLLRQLLEIPASSDPRQMLEIVLLEAATANSTSDDLPQGSPPELEPKPEIETITPRESTPQPTGDGFSLNQWPEVLDKVKLAQPPLYSALRLAKPGLEDGELLLYFEFPLHQKKVDSSQNRDLIAKMIEEVSGQKLSVRTSAKKEQPITSGTAKPAADVENISNIFGDAEVLES